MPDPRVRVLAGRITLLCDECGEWESLDAICRLSDLVLWEHDHTTGHIIQQHKENAA